MKNKMKKILLFGMTAVLSVGMADMTIMPDPVWAEESKNITENSKDEKGISQLKEIEHPKISIYNIREFSIVKSGEEVFKIRQEPAEYKLSFDYWEIINPYDEILTVNTEKMYEMFQVLADLDLDDPIDVKDIDTGLYDTRTYFTIDFVDTVDEDLARGSEVADARATILIGNADENGNYYACVKGYEDAGYLLSKESVNDLLEVKPFDLILKIPVLINIDTLDRVEINIGKKAYTMKLENGEYKFGKRTVKKESFTELYQALQSVILDSEIEETKDISDKKEVLTVTFCRNIEKAPSVTLKYYTYDEDHDSLEINGTERFLVKNSEVNALVKQIKKHFR